MAAGTPLSPAPSSDPNADSRVPGQFDDTSLAMAISTRLGVGNAAAILQKQVVWTSRGDEVLLHLDSVRVKTAERLLFVSVDLETDQTGRTPLVCAFAVGNDKDPAGLIAVTDDLPRGNGVLAARWGKTLQEAVWATVLSISTDHAASASATAIGISVTPGSLRVQTSTALVWRLKTENPGGKPGAVPGLIPDNKGGA